MLDIEKINKRFGGFSVRDVSFSVQEGEYYIILGDSGAGKSLLLEMIAGLVRPDSGRVILNGLDITHRKIQDRGIGLVFQDYAVFPHLTVRENIGYSLHGTHLTRQEKREKIRAVAAKMNIGHLLDRRPPSLSGGELQRIALARTLVQNPKILLLDEPLSSLDPKLRSEIRSLLRQLNREGQTVIHVTHDYEEAISLADTIAVVYDGEIIQSGTPGEVFSHPKSEFVAHFIGIRNFFKVRIVREQGTVHAVINERLTVNLGNGEYSDEGYILFRNEDIILSKTRFDSSITNTFSGTVTEVVPSRSGFDITVDIGVSVHASITEQSIGHLGIREQEELFISFKATAVKFIDA